MKYYQALRGPKSRRRSEIQRPRTLSIRTTIYLELPPQIVRITRSLPHPLSLLYDILGYHVGKNVDVGLLEL